MKKPSKHKPKPQDIEIYNLLRHRYSDEEIASYILDVDSLPEFLTATHIARLNRHVLQAHEIQDVVQEIGAIRVSKKLNVSYNTAYRWETRVFLPSKKHQLELLRLYASLKRCQGCGKIESACICGGE